uniref:Uncharacterized protein n=1 Tax=Salix viminalis TaxID=40686 RepID=A0A6N2NE80_SALVM
MNKRVQQNLAVWKQVWRSERGLGTLFSRSLTLSGLFISPSLYSRYKTSSSPNQNKRKGKNVSCVLSR